ncbi:hypothetical protein FA95DRAFT_1608515 [Auriscalpium vulgare]|uniref:Uncharacterized protein n=1 Tax=Auriscalpium vulgare TaxID=40419 RepID=A0ACB8RLE0_9AGAM|nr:hypothetical protein FA95DRAFT_1608515 [Auriscalpium vulgare]
MFPRELSVERDDSDVRHFPRVDEIGSRARWWFMGGISGWALKLQWCFAALPDSSRSLLSEQDGEVARYSVDFTAFHGWHHGDIAPLADPVSGRLSFLLALVLLLAYPRHAPPGQSSATQSDSFIRAVSQPVPPHPCPEFHKFCPLTLMTTMNTSATAPTPPSLSQASLAEIVDAHRRIAEAHQGIAEQYKRLATATASASATGTATAASGVVAGRLSGSALGGASQPPNSPGSFAFLGQHAYNASNSVFSGQSTNAYVSPFGGQPTNPPALTFTGSSLNKEASKFMDVNRKGLDNANRALTGGVNNEISSDRVPRMKEVLQWTDEVRRVRAANSFRGTGRLQLIPPWPCSKYTGAWPPPGDPKDLWNVSEETADDMLKAYELSDEGSLEKKRARLHAFMVHGVDDSDYLAA